MRWKHISSFLLALCLCVTMLPVSANASTNETIIYQFLKDELGFNTAAACGVLANIEIESGFRNDIVEYGYTWETGGAYGICQWMNSPRTSPTGRRTNLVNWCTNNGYDYTSLIGQLNYLKYELSTSYYYSRVTSKLLAVENSAQGAYDAGYYWCYYFEIPAGYNTGVSEERGNKARDTYWPEYSGTPVVHSCSCSEEYAGTFICTTSKNPLTIRKGHGTSYEAIGYIPSGAEVTVTKASGTANSDWAHVTYNGISGYASVKYLSMHEHNYSVSVAPTATDTGVLTRSCSYCPGDITLTLPELNDTDYTYKVTKPALCEENGIGRYTWNNSSYGDVYVELSVAPTGHSYSYVGKANQFYHYTCVNCGGSYREYYTFPDVPEGLWCYDAVKFSVTKGYFTGYKSGNFGPDDKITRQDFVVVLARVAGVDLSQYSGRTGFPDVKAGDYYEKAVKWASSNGIVNGYKNGNFGVGDSITREQLVTILYNFARKNGYDVSVPDSAAAKLSGYTDAHKITGYARNAVIWALHKGVISGMTATTIAPQNTASRAQTATILMNISKKGIMEI